MKIIITERQYKKLIENNQFSLFDNEVENICGKEIEYENFGFDKYYRMVYVNLPYNTSDEREELYSQIKSSNCDIVLYNVLTNEKFTVSSDDIKLTKEHKKIYIPTSVYEQKIVPYLPKIEQYEKYINSGFIKKALKRAFTDNWIERTDTHVAGVVGVLPIPGVENQWSIVNFFNSKTSIITLIKIFLARDYKNNKFNPSKDIKESVILWMENLFKDIDSDDMKRLVKIQLKSIIDGFNDELNNAKLIQKKLHPGKDIDISGFGTIKDIEQGVDATIDGITYQIKPFSNIKNIDNSMFVSIGGSNSNTYNTTYVNRIAFIKGEQLYVFKNNGNPPNGNTYEFKIDKKNEQENELIYSPNFN